MTGSIAALVLLVALAGPAAAQSRQAPQPPPPAPGVGGAPDRAEPAPAVVTEVGGESVWFTVVPEGDTFSVSMPGEPTVQAVREVGGGFSVVYTSIGSDIVCMVMSSQMGDAPARANAELTPAAFTTLSLEMIAAGMKPRGIDPSVEFVRTVRQAGLVGGEGTLAAGGSAFYGRARAFRKADRAYIVVALASVPLTAADASERFLSSFAPAVDPASRSALKLGTKEFRRPVRPDPASLSETEAAPDVTRAAR